MVRCLVRAAVVWMLLIATEVVHGIARGVWLVPVVGDFRARQIGVFSGSLLILVIVRVTIRWMQVPMKPLLVSIGFLWVVLTVGFELGFGRLVLDSSWDRLASDYDLPGGWTAADRSVGDGVLAVARDTHPRRGTRTAADVPVR